MASAGQLKERVLFERAGLDANGDRLGDFEAFYDCRAGVVTGAGPMRQMDQRLEGKDVITITVRSCGLARQIESSAEFRAIWQRYPGQTFTIESVSEDPAHRWITILAAAAVGGPGG